MALSCTINTDPALPKVNSVNLEFDAGQRSTASLVIEDPTGAYNPIVGWPVTFSDGGSLKFGGTIANIERGRLDESTSGLCYNITATGWENRLDKRFVGTGAPPYGVFVYAPITFAAAVSDVLTAVGHNLLDDYAVQAWSTGTLPAGLAVATTYYVVKLTADTLKLSSTVGGGNIIDITDVGTGEHELKWMAGSVVKHALANWCGSEGITAGTISNGAAIEKIPCDWKRVSELLDDCATASNYLWYITPAKVLHFIPRTATAGTYNLTDASKNFRALTIKTDRSQYWNRGMRRVAWAAFGKTEETLTCDGAVTSWLLDHNVAVLDKITLNGVDQTVGERWVYSAGVKALATGYHFYYDPAMKGIWQDMAEMPGTLQATDVLVVTYRELGTDVIDDFDAGEMAARAAIEGGSGDYGHFTDDSQNVDAVGALALEVALRVQHQAIPLEISWEADSLETNSGDLRPGVLITVAVTGPPAVSGTFLTTSVTARDVDGLYLVYTVQATDKTIAARTGLGLFEEFMAPRIGGAVGGGGIGGVVPSAPVPAGVAPNQTPVTGGSNPCKVDYYGSGTAAHWFFRGSVTCATSAATYGNLAWLEIAAILTSGSAAERILGYLPLPAPGSGDVDVIWYADAQPLPTIDETYTLEFRSYNADGIMTAAPPTVTGLVAYADSTDTPLVIQAVTSFTVTDLGMTPDQKYREFNCQWTMPAIMTNAWGVKVRVTGITKFPSGQDVTELITFPTTYAGLPFGRVVGIAAADLPASAENWTFKAITVNAAQDGDNTATAPSAVKSVAPGSAVPDLLPPLACATVVGADIGNRLLLGNNEPYTFIRATVTLPANHRATRLLLWISEDNGTTWGAITHQWAVGSGLTFAFVMRVPATAQTDWKVKVTTANEQSTPTEAAAVVSSAFSVAAVSATTPTGARAASVGTVVYVKDADGQWHWSASYVKWTTPAADPNFFHSQLTVQLVNGSGTPDPAGDLGTERVVDESTLVGLEFTSSGVFNWWIPPASYGYRYHRFRIYGVNRAGVRTLYTGCWAGAANYLDVLPAEQTGALQVQRADPLILGPELSIGVSVAGGTPLLRTAADIGPNVLPNPTFQLAHPTTANWSDKWTKTGTVTRKTGGESGDYIMKLADQATLTSGLVRIAPGQRYNTVGRWKGDSGGPTCWLIYQMWDVAGNNIMSWAAGSYIGIAPGTAWEDVGLSYTILPTYGSPAVVPYYMSVLLYNGGTATGKFLYVDRLQTTLVTMQSDLYSAGVNTTVTLGQHLNPSSQFVGVGVARSNGWSVEHRDNYLEIKCPSGRSLCRLYGVDSSPDYSQFTLLSDTVSGHPSVAILGSTIFVNYDGVGGNEATLYANATGGRLQINGFQVVGQQGVHIANPTGGGVFTDRGDPAAADKTLTGITLGAWTDWDLSAIVPAGATAVLLRVQIGHSATGANVEFRKNGQSNAVNTAKLYTQVANITLVSDVIVPCDSGRVIEYFALNAATWALINLTVAGWWSVDAEARTAISSGFAALETHGLLASS